jgi:DNA-directed RNA polymerase specialized sigma24 family protein
VDPSQPPLSSRGSASRKFATTHWSIVLSAGRDPSADAGAAMASLCETYWYPVYAFIRRRGGDADKAMDLTQGFFARLLEKRDLAGVDRARGRFRSWLMAAVKHYLSNERDYARADKRGGGHPPISIDAADAESRYSLEPSHELTPDRIFERRWALMLLEHVLSALRRECVDDGKGELFDALKECIGGRPGDSRYREVAAQFDMGEGAVRMAAHRLRRRYRELLRQHIAETVETPEQIEDEIGFLFSALG